MNLLFLKDLDWVVFLWGAAVVPLLGGLGVLIRVWWERKGRKKGLVLHLCRLPPQAKAYLLPFYYKETDTIPGDPLLPVACFLIEEGIIRRGPGAGGYRAANCNMTVSAEFWEVFKNWVKADWPAVEPIVRQLVEELDDGSL